MAGLLPPNDLCAKEGQELGRHPNSQARQGTEPACCSAYRQAGREPPAPALWDRTDRLFCLSTSMNMAAGGRRGGYSCCGTSRRELPMPDHRHFQAAAHWALPVFSMPGTVPGEPRLGQAGMGMPGGWRLAAWRNSGRQAGMAAEPCLQLAAWLDSVPAGRTPCPSSPIIQTGSLLLCY